MEAADDTSETQSQTQTDLLWDHTGDVESDPLLGREDGCERRVSPFRWVQPAADDWTFRQSGREVDFKWSWNTVDLPLTIDIFIVINHYPENYITYKVSSAQSKQANKQCNNSNSDNNNNKRSQSNQG